MSLKVKRGLGLLVVAVLGYLIVFMAQSGGDGGMAAGIAELIGYLLVLVGLIPGLVLIAWGLLRD